VRGFFFWMARFDEPIRPMILGDMRADGVRSLNCQGFSFEHQAFPARARQPKPVPRCGSQAALMGAGRLSESPSRRRFLERKAPAGATDMPINIGARERFECEVVHIPSNAFCLRMLFANFAARCDTAEICGRTGSLGLDQRGRTSMPGRHRRAVAEYTSGRARERFPTARRAVGRS
jgi:hypothetical protein